MPEKNKSNLKKKRIIGQSWQPPPPPKPKRKNVEKTEGEVSWTPPFPPKTEQP